MEAMSEQDRFANGNLPRVVELCKDQRFIQRQLDHWEAQQGFAETALERAQSEVARLAIAASGQLTLFEIKE
jgi:hypothetical protein